MSKIKLTGSNSGYVEISSAADAGNLTLALPTSGTVLLSNVGNVFSGITTTGQLDINGSIDVSSTSVFNDDLTLTGASYNVVWDKSDNQLEFGDNAKLSFGGSSDMQLYHTGSHFYISNSTGYLFLQSDSISLAGKSAGQNYLVANLNGAVSLHYSGNQKFQTTNTGAVVTGICTATSFSGSGAGLTGLVTPLGNRNMIINGAAMISQRLGTNTYNLTNVSSWYPVDRYPCWSVGGGTLTIQQSADAPSGFQNSIMFTVNTADTDALSQNGTYYIMQQRIEGYDTRRLNMGQSNAQSSTLSFWVKSDVTGTYCVMLNNQLQNRCYTKEFTVSSADTWEYKTITYPGDTTGTWYHDHQGGVQLNWCLASGANYQGTANQWNTSWKDHTSNQVNFMATSGNKIRFTGIQLEKGTTATEFEHRTYEEEHARCQRFYQKIPANSGVYVPMNGSYARINVLFPTTMRTTPSVTLTPGWDGLTATTHGVMAYKSGNNTMPQIQAVAEI